MFEARIEKLYSIRFDGPDAAVEMHFGNDGSSVFMGAKRKDFFCPDENWEAQLVSGVALRLWTLQWSRIAGIEVRVDGAWKTLWFCGNDFQTKADRERSEKGYANFIEDEGKRIAKWIDAGKTLQEIESSVSDEHTGNTMGCAMAMGIQTATDRVKAESIRKVWNKDHGVAEDHGGVVNPAILTIQT